MTARNVIPPPEFFGLNRPAYRVKELVTTRKQPGILPFGRNVFYRFVGNGEIKLVKIGGASCVFARDLAAFLHKRHAA